MSTASAATPRLASTAAQAQRCEIVRKRGSGIASSTYQRERAAAIGASLLLAPNELIALPRKWCAGRKNSKGFDRSKDQLPKAPAMGCQRPIFTGSAG